MKQVVTRKDGITYERELKLNNYNKIISLRISEEQYNKLNELSKKQNKNIADIIRDAIEDYYMDK